MTDADTAWVDERLRRAADRVAEAADLVTAEQATRAEVAAVEAEIARTDADRRREQQEVDRLTDLGPTRIRAFVRGTLDDDLLAERADLDRADARQTVLRQRLEDAQIAWSQTYQRLTAYADADDELTAALQAKEDLLIHLGDWRGDRLVDLHGDTERIRRQIAVLDASYSRVEECRGVVFRLARAVSYALTVGRISPAVARLLDAERQVAAGRLALLARVLDAAEVARGWQIDELSRVPGPGGETGLWALSRATEQLDEVVRRQLVTLDQVAALFPGERLHRVQAVEALAMQRREVLFGPG